MAIGNRETLDQMIANLLEQRRLDLEADQRARKAEDKRRNEERLKEIQEEARLGKQAKIDTYNARHKQIVDARSPMKVATKRNRIAAYYARNDYEIADARGGPDTTVDVDVDLMWELIQAFRDATDVDGVSEAGLRSALAAHGLEVFWMKERS